MLFSRTFVYETYYNPNPPNSKSSSLFFTFSLLYLFRLYILKRHLLKLCSLMLSKFKNKQKPFLYLAINV